MPPRPSKTRVKNDATQASPPSHADTVVAGPGLLTPVAVQVAPSQVDKSCPPFTIPSSASMASTSMTSSIRSQAEILRLSRRPSTATASIARLSDGEYDVSEDELRQGSKTSMSKGPLPKRFQLLRLMKKNDNDLPTDSGPT